MNIIKERYIRYIINKMTIIQKVKELLNEKDKEIEAIVEDKLSDLFDTSGEEILEEIKGDEYDDNVEEIEELMAEKIREHIDKWSDKGRK